MTTQMATSTRPLRAWTIGIALLAAACSDRSAKRPSVDSDLARDLALAGTGTQAAQPTFQDTAMAPAPTPAARAKQQPPAPVRTRAGHTPPPKVEPPPQRVAQAPPSQQPTPAPVTQAAAPAPGPAPVHAEIGIGTGASLTSGSKVCTSSLPGDKMVATVNSAITGTNGAVIPAGSSVVLEVASVNPGQNGDGAQINFRVRAIVVNDKTYSATADIAPQTPLEKTKVENADPNADKKKVIGGAIAGALIGQIIGHNTKGTLIGAAAGAATGAAVAKSGEKWEGCLPAGAALRLTFSSPLTMS